LRAFVCAYRAAQKLSERACAIASHHLAVIGSGLSGTISGTKPYLLRLGIKPLCCGAVEHCLAGV
jgi:hypothetical protein